MPDLQSAASGLGVACAVVAVLRRKQAIGGWLFYFFCQVLLGLALVVATTRWRTYAPAEWLDAGHYFLFTISGLSRDILFAAVALVCVQLVRTRDWQWVVALRCALAAYAFATLLKLQVDVLYVPASAARDALSLAFPVVWMGYFAVSERVRRVFFEKSG